MKMTELVVSVADVGSVGQNNFGWCRSISRREVINTTTGTDICEFAKGVADDLSSGRKVALGFECPLFVPIANNPASLTRAREGEGNRPWSAAAGACSLATGLTECCWIFKKVKSLARDVQTTLNWEEFCKSEANLFIWEAFVSRAANGNHCDDATSAACKFWRQYPNITEANAVTVQETFSLVGATLLRSGLITDLSVLCEPCIVIKVD